MGLSVPAAAEGVKAFPWITQADPRIVTRTFITPSGPFVDGTRIVILPFDQPPGGPAPPPFGEFVFQGLLQQGHAESIVSLPSTPWAEPPAWKAGRQTDADRFAAAALEGREHGCQYVVTGRVHWVFRTTAYGLRARVTIWVVAAETAEVVWYGTKTADWIRAYPLEDCLLRLAWSFVSDWEAPAP